MKYPEVGQEGEYKVIKYKDMTMTVKYKPKPAPDGSETSLEALHPIFQPKAKLLVNELKKKFAQLEYRVQVNCTFRSKEEQEKLLKTSKYASKVSPHCFGLAIDLSVVNKQGKAVTSQPEVQKILEETAEKLGIYWGGWFSSVKEPWHFQIALKWQNLV